MKDTFFVFDVESVGLHGEGFAVAGGVYLAGSSQWEFCYACPTDEAEGDLEGRRWVKENVPEMDITHRDTYGLRLAFWEAWERAKSGSAEMAAECLWPVEARFLRDCITDDAQRLASAPYPIHEIASVMLAAGMDPLATYDRTPSEMPRHNPLADARQSARLLSEALAVLAKMEQRKS